ncbi:B12-binding domain-containing radical SAM protein [Patescibacteria group bacterium]|nr:B12-binding domain-containing radical SAM protein [Patescibacteria group bacterium]
MNAKKTRIVLINPPASHIVEKHYQKASMPRIALAYLAASLKKNNISYEVIDAKFEGLTLKETLKRLKNIKFSMVGITAMTTEILDAAELATEIKKNSPSCKIVIGGAHATALPEDILKEFYCFDIACFGEGEITIQQLAFGKDLHKIEGISFRSDGQIIKNCQREFIKNLDELPIPDWDAFLPAKQYPILSSRGCAFRCNFCMRVLGNRIRFRDPEAVFEEMKYVYMRFKPDFFYFYDETFGFYKDKAEQLLCSLIREGLNKKVQWSVQTRVDIIDSSLFVLMKEAGCVWVGFGIESGNSDVLDKTGKRINLLKAEKAIAMARKAGLKTGTFFILGHPHENKKTIEDTIDFALKLDSTTLALGIMVPYPGTEIYEMAKKNQGGYKIIAKSWADYNKQEGGALELEYLSLKDLRRYQLIGYLKFYLLRFRLDKIRELFKSISLISLLKTLVVRFFQ